LVILLSALAAGSWWLSRDTEQDLGYQPKPHSLDYYLENFRATAMGMNGEPDKQLSGQRMAHFPDDDSTELTAPQMTLYDEHSPPWKIRSERGWVSGDKQLILLQGMVNIDRNGAPGVRPMHIITRDLHIQPEENYAETDQDVFVRSDEDRLESRGMQAWFAKPMRIKLLANVRGRYDPE